MFKPLREGPKRHTWNVIFSKNFIIFTVLSHFTTYVPRLKSSLHHTVVVFVKNCPKTLRHFCLLNPWTMNQFNQNIKYLVRHLSQYYVMTLIQYFGSLSFNLSIERHSKDQNFGKSWCLASLQTVLNLESPLNCEVR